MTSPRLARTWRWGTEGEDAIENAASAAGSGRSGDGCGTGRAGSGLGQGTRRRAPARDTHEPPRTSTSQPTCSTTSARIQPRTGNRPYQHPAPSSVRDARTGAVGRRSQRAAQAKRPVPTTMESGRRRHSTTSATAALRATTTARLWPRVARGSFGVEVLPGRLPRMAMPSLRWAGRGCLPCRAFRRRSGRSGLGLRATVPRSVSPPPRCRCRPPSDESARPRRTCSSP